MSALTRNRRPLLRLVGGTEVETEISAALPTLQRHGPRGHGRRVKAAKDEADPIFYAIARHRVALAAYNFAVDNDEYTNGPYDDLILMWRIVVMTEPTTRRGLIAVAKYLEEQFDMGCMSLMDCKTSGKLWPQVFMRTLRQALSHMAPELGK
jgi:hypothetical protein